MHGSSEPETGGMTLPIAERAVADPDAGFVRGCPGAASSDKTDFTSMAQDDDPYGHCSKDVSLITPANPTHPTSPMELLPAIRHRYQSTLCPHLSMQMHACYFISADLPGGCISTNCQQWPLWYLI